MKPKQLIEVKWCELPVLGAGKHDGFMTHRSSVMWPLSAQTPLYLWEANASCLNVNGVLEEILSCTGQIPKYILQHCHNMKQSYIDWLCILYIYIYIIVKWRKLLFLTISVRKSETHGDGDEPERHLPQKLWATSAQSWSDVTLPSVNTQDLLHRVQILNSADYGILKINVSFMSCQLLPL